MDELIQALKSVGIDIYHTPADKNAPLPYIVYAPYAESYFRADNSIDEVTEHIQVGYYTKAENDPNKRKIRQALDDAGIVFDYQCMYEDAEKVYHHIFDCEA